MSCMDKDITNTLPADDTALTEIPINAFQSASFTRVPFLFDILALLKKSKLIISMYPLMKELPQGMGISQRHI